MTADNLPSNCASPAFNPERETGVSAGTEFGEDRRPGVPVLANPVYRYSAHTFSRHSHYRGQLFFAISGSLDVVTEQGAWTLPPQQALWVPPGIDHEVHFTTEVEGRFLYVHPDACGPLPATCVVIASTALLRALIANINNDRNPASPRVMRMHAVIIDEIANYTPAPLDLPLPGEKRLKRVAAGLRASPGSNLTLKEWAEQVGASERTLARLFERELGMTFGEWRQRLRLQRAVSMLANGAPITQVAIDLGYAGTSAFSAMFRRALGTSPSRYVGRDTES